MAPRSEEEEDLGDVGESGGWAQGLSKGVFALKRRSTSGSPRYRTKSPKKGALKRRRVCLTGSAAQLGGSDTYLQQCFASYHEKWAKERVDVHESIRVEVERRVEGIQDQIYKDVYTSILNFVKTSQELVDRTIPAAVLLTGVNMPDHAKVFGNLIQRVGEVTPHISLLGAGQTIKQMVANLVMDIVNAQDDEMSMVKKSDASFGLLEKWYSNQYGGSTDPSPPLVLIIQDFENCSGSAVNDLITMCSRYKSSLPFVVVLGVATTLSALHKTLPQSTTAQLTISTFGSPSASKHLEQVIESVIIDPKVEFKLSDKVLQFLLENFLFHDFAVKHFLDGYRFILGEHFFKNPAAILMMKGGEEMLNSMDLEEFSYICTYPSFRKYISGLEVEEQAETLVNLDKCRDTVKTLIKEYKEHTENFTVTVTTLHILARDLPRRPLGRLLRDVYSSALGGGIETTSQYREAFQFLKLSNRIDLETKLGLIITEIESCPGLISFGEKLKDTLTRLQELETDAKLEGSPAVQSLSAKFSSCASTPSSGSTSQTPAGSTLNTPGTCSMGITPLLQTTAITTQKSLPGSNAGSPFTGKGKLDRFKLQASLLEHAQKNMLSQVRPFDKIRSELMQVLHEHFKEFLVPPTSRPLHEMFVFTSTRTVRSHLAGAPRAALHTALTDPFLYLEAPDLKIDSLDEIPATLPDICIAYKLHLECPRLINVFDWLSCWHSIVSGGDNPISQEEQARFTRVVSELHHLGFIKTSTRKTDHVARLTFGGS